MAMLVITRLGNPHVSHHVMGISPPAAGVAQVLGPPRGEGLIGGTMCQSMEQPGGPRGRWAQREMNGDINSYVLGRLFGFMDFYLDLMFVWISC